MAVLATSAAVSLPQPLIDTKFVVRFFTLSHKSRLLFQAEKIPRLTCHSQVPPEIKEAVRNVLDDDGKRHLKGAKTIVKWIQSLESGRVECALDYLITAQAHVQFARFFANGPIEVQVGYWDTTRLDILVIADFAQLFVQLLAGVLFGFLACGNAHHANSAIRQNISGVCLRLLSSPLPDQCIQSAWILGNLACESTAYATSFISAGVPEQLVRSIKHYIDVDRSSTNTPQTATIIWTLNSLEKGGPYLLDENLVRPPFSTSSSIY